MNQYACAITGHRPTRFCFGYNEEDPLCQKLKECLLEQFRILHDEKFVRTFFVGGALGVDMWAGEQLLTLRAQTGYEDIKIIVVVPFIGYDSKWPDQSRHRLKKLIQNANDSIVISHSADVSSYKKRNYYMVDHAEYIIGVGLAEATFIVAASRSFISSSLIWSAVGLFTSATIWPSANTSARSA